MGVYRGVTPKRYTMSHQFPEDVTANLPDDFLRLFGDHKPIKNDHSYDLDKRGNSVKTYYMTCCYCGRDLVSKRAHSLYHPECRQRLRRARKAYLEENWFGLVILYFIFIIIENIPSYEAKSNTAKS